ncbi:Outer membrane receptor protein [Ignavibacterium album JCM 16511]|uniref:Outer membrane receptor protein n=1 Tax=Ignavibacterium album (strain DSM 19864 / JCM 16511 / NBRC 101810 / Mat9-16) TaxID=945713 RepID=I0AKI6_IGNAJ|nr:TonB-dependent receptor [Ignavibacterium album]AFH49493.1 Outer membrane receptor protein [Ignavibacterium album JCM 16511]
MRLLFNTTFVVVVCIFLFSSSVYTQSKTEAKKDTLKYQLEQVTVTATRYTENILEVPYAISILLKEQIQNTKGYGLDEALSSVPGVLAQSRSGNQDIRLVIRGFGARGAGDRSNSGTSRGVRIMLNGIPETEPDGRTSFDNIDLSLADNIEVIRSNSSALWGNASGGVVNVSTVSDFSNPFLQVGGTFGSFGFRKYTLKSGTLLGIGKLSIGVSNITFDGWRERSGSKRTIVDINLVSRLSDLTKLGVFLTGAGNLFHIPGPLTQTQFDADPKQSNTTYKQRDERRYNRLGRAGITLDHDINETHGFSSMVFVNPKYLQRSERGTFRDFTRYHFGGNLIYRNSLKFDNNIENKLVVGADEAYQDGAILFYTLSPTNGRGSTLRDNKREGANTFGAFLQDEIRFGESFSLLVGGRYDNITYYSESFIDPALGLQKKSFEKFTPKAGLTYMFSKTHSVYFNLGGGVEVPAGNETDPAGTFGQDTVYLINPLLEPIESTTLELGTKQVLFISDNSLIKSLSYDLALYYIMIKNDIIPYRGGRFYFTAGKTNRMGAEAGFNLQFDGGLSLQGSLTLSSNKYEDYKVDSVHYGVPGSFADYKDNKVAGIPDMLYYASLNYAPEFLKGVFVGFSLNGMGSYFVDDANKIEVPSYNILNAVLGVRNFIDLTENLSLSGFVSVNNLTDKKYVASAFINPDIVGGVPVYLEPGLPRNITVSVSLGIR